MQTTNPCWAWVALCAVSPVLASGNALNFDGGDDRVQAAALPPVFASGTTIPFTVDAWLYRIGAPVFGRVLFAQQSTSNFVAIAEGGGGNIYAYVILNGTTFSVATNASMPRNAWTHVAVRWTAGAPEVLFNGVVQAGTAGGTSSTATNGVMMIGARTDGAQPLSSGHIDELRVWNRALSDCEIKRTRFEQPPLDTNGLEVRYDFNQGVAGGDNTGVTLLPDVAGADQDGTLANFALTGATSNWVASDIPTSAPGSVLVDRTALVTAEYGLSDGFNVVLESAPTENVTITLTGDASEGEIVPSELTFTPIDWNIAQGVVVTGVDDFEPDGDIAYTLTLTTNGGADPVYSCVAPIEIDVVNHILELFTDGFE